MKPLGSPRGAVAFIFLTVLLDTISFGIILPVLPELIMELGGVDLPRAAILGGWLAFAYAGTQFVCAPLMGNLGDRFGRRPVLLAAVAAFGIDYLVMGLAPTLAWLFAARVVAGIAGASFAPAYAALADISPPEKRAQNFGLVGGAFGAGFVLGPAIGGLLGELGPRAPFFAAAAVSLANFAFGLFVLPETLPPAQRRTFSLKRANPVGTLLSLRRYPQVMGLAATVFVWQFAHQVLPGTWSFYTMFKFGWSEAQVGYSLAFVGVIMALSQALLTRLLIPRIGVRHAVILGLCGGFAMYAVSGLATQTWMVYAGMLTWLVGGLAYPSINGLMSQMVPADQQGELQGGIHSLFSLSTIAGPPAMTWVFAEFSRPDAALLFPGAAFILAATLVLVSLALFLRAAPKAT